jgi:hypothetical protein
MNEKRNDPRPRIAASSYLNTAPLIWSFIHGSQRDAVELFTDTAPARCANALRVMRSTSRWFQSLNTSEFPTSRSFPMFAWVRAQPCGVVLGPGATI